MRYFVEWSRSLIRGESAQASLERAGVFAIAAIIIAVLLGSGAIWGSSLACTIDTAINGGSGGCGTGASSGTVSQGDKTVTAGLPGDNRSGHGLPQTGGNGGGFMSPEVSGAVAGASDFFGTASAVLSVVALGSLLIPVVGEVAAPILGAAAIVTGGLSAVGDVLLAANGDKTWAEAGVSVAFAGLAMFGGGLARVGAKVIPGLMPGVVKAAGATVGKAKGVIKGFVTKFHPKLSQPRNPQPPKPPTAGAKPKSIVAGLQDDAIAAAEKTGTRNLTSIQKGNYGEMKMDRYFESQGYERVSVERVTDINTPSHRGIDGVYYKPGGDPPYVVAEAKYGTSGLDKTKDGKQMCAKWIENRLSKAVSPEVLRDMQLQGYGSSLVKVSPEGTITTKLLDAAGNVIK